MREYAYDAQVKLNQRGCERMDFVIGFKFMASKIPADPLLYRWMYLRWRGAIHQFNQEYQNVCYDNPTLRLNRTASSVTPHFMVFGVFASLSCTSTRDREPPSDFKARLIRREQCHAGESGGNVLPEVHPVQQGNFSAADPVLFIASFFLASWKPL
jgi:hypothetical protein